MAKIKKRYRKKNKSQSSFGRKIIYLFILTFLSILFIISFFLFSSYYKIEKIEVEGLTLNSDDSIRKLIKENSEVQFFWKSNSSIFFPKNKIEKKILNKFPYIKQVETVKIFPNKIFIEIKERASEFVWCVDFEDNFSCYEIDSSGIVFSEIDFDGDIFYIYHQYPELVSLGEKVFSDDEFVFIFDTIKLLENEFNFKLTKMSVLHQNSFFVQTDLGFKIYFNFQDLLKNQLKRLKLLIDKEIDTFEDLNYIDLRYESQVYYK